jgi:hypothetical protein
MLFFLLHDHVHVPGVRGVPQLDKPYFPTAIYLGGNMIVSISSPFLQSPVNLFVRDLRYHAVWAKFLFIFKGEIKLLYCVGGDQPLGEAFRNSPKFFHYHSHSHVCRAVAVPRAAILDFFHDENAGRNFMHLV